MRTDVLVWFNELPEQERMEVVRKIVARRPPRLRHASITNQEINDFYNKRIKELEFDPIRFKNYISRFNKSSRPRMIELINEL